MKKCVCSATCLLVLSAASLAAQPAANAPASGNASPQSIDAAAKAKTYADRIKAVLPKGWSVKTEKNAVTVSREDKVEWFGTVQLPDHKDKADLKSKGFVYLSTYEIRMEFAPPTTEKEIARLKEDNERIAERYYKFHPKSTSMIPVGDPWELRQLYHRIPNVLAGDCSVFFSTTVDGDLAFYDDAVGRECNGVAKIVRELLAAAPTSTPASAPAADSDKPETLSARIVIPAGGKLVKGFFPGAIELVNNSDSPLRVCTRCVDGRGVSKDVGFSHVVLIAERWRTDPPTPEEMANSSVEVAAGKTVTLPFRAVCKKPGKLKLSAAYDVPEENVPLKRGIWTGRVSAEPVELEVNDDGVTVLTPSSQPASQKASGTRQ